jgi:hypothetical protein
MSAASDYYSLANRGFRSEVGREDMTDEKRELERRWLELWEKLGPEVVRARLTNRMTVWMPERYGMDPPDHPFVVAWLAEKAKSARRRETRRFWIIAIIASLTLLAATYPLACRHFPMTWTSLKKLCSE